jgi:hypothetical protein
MPRKSYLPDTAKVLDSTISAAAKGPRTTPQQRKSGRVHIEALPCNLGRVLDLSAGGVRLATNKKLPDVVQIMLGDRQNHLSATATVAWQKRVGWKSHEAGISFGELTPEQKACLIKLMHNSARATREAA